MAIHTTNNSNKSNNQPTFSINLEDDSVQFNPSKTFAHVNAEQVLKIISKGDLEACDVNKKGFINYQLTNSNRILGFINFYDNGLDKNSSDSDIKASVTNLKKELSSVKLDDITVPLTEDEADDLIAGM